MRVTRATAIAGAALTVTGVVGLVAGAGTPAVAAGGVYDVHATADGIRIGVAVNNFLVFSQLVDGGGPTAQALVDGFGDSRAFAALPYPGETALGLPAQAGSPVGYPLIARSSFPTQPKGELSAGPYDLLATSATDHSAATGAVDATGSGATRVGYDRATVSTAHDAASGTVTAQADAMTESIEIAGVVTISRIHSAAKVVSTPGSKPVVTSDTELGEMEVAGTPVGLTDKGLVLPGSTVPVPPDSQVSKALEGAGVTIQYLARHQDAEGEVTAPAVAISVTRDVPNVGTAVVTYTLGGSIAGAQPGSSLSGGSSSGGAATGVTATTGGGSTAPASTGSAQSPSLGSTAGAQPPTIPSSTGTSSAGPADRQPALAGGGQMRPVAANPGPALDSVYALLALVGLLVLGAGTVFRLIAVRLVWTS